MEALYCIEELTQKKFSKEIEVHLKNLDEAVRFCSSVSEKGWARFSEILSVSEKNPTFWDKEETQKELQELCTLIDVRELATQDDENMNLSLGSLREFLNCIDQDHFKVSWDLLYSMDCTLLDQPLRKVDPLFPEDVLGLFVILDRMVLFLREEQRCLRYNLISKRIQTFNEQDFLFLSLNSQVASL